MVNQAIKVIIMKSIEISFTTDPVRGDIEGPVYDPDIEVIIMDSIEVSSTTDQIRGDIDCPFYDPDIEGIEGFSQQIQVLLYTGDIECLYQSPFTTQRCLS